MKFTEEIEEYVVLKLPLNEYKETKRTLKDGFVIGSIELRDQIRKDEKKLLQKYFRSWRRPYENKLKGWREDSPL